MYDCGTSGITGPENGDVNLDAGTTLGAMATFSCDQGYLQVGDQSRTCELDGWSGSNPVCGEYAIYKLDHSARITSYFYDTRGLIHLVILCCSFYSFFRECI